MTWNLAVLALGALAWAGCARSVLPQVRYTESTPAQARSRPRPAPAEIAVLAARAPQRAHQRIGELEVRISPGEDADRAAMLAALRARAAEAGCDAVLLHGPWYETTTEQPVYRQLVTRSVPIYRATCLVYDDPAAPAAPGTPAPETPAPETPAPETLDAPASGGAPQ